MSDPTSIWDDPDVKTNDDYVTFDAIGDGVSGIIAHIGKHTFDDGKVAAQLLIACDDGVERTLTAGQVRLKAALVEQRPMVGDHLQVHLSQIEKRSGGKTLKHFTVAIVRGGAPVAPSPVAGIPAAAPAAAPVAAAPAPAVAAVPAVDPAAAAAALAALSPEQRAALGLPPA